MENPLKYFAELRDKGKRLKAAWNHPYLLKLLGI